MAKEEKKFRFSIGAKLYLGFGVLIVSTLIAFILTLFTLKTSREINDKIETVITPSVDALEELNLTVVRSKMWINNWVKAKSVNDNPDATRLKKLIDVEYPSIKAKILKVSENWEDEKDKLKVRRIFGQIDTLFLYDKDIMGQLNTMEAYNDPMIKMLIEPMIEESGEIGDQASKIFSSLDLLIEHQRIVSKEYSHKMLLAFNLLQFVVQALGFALTIGGILIAFFTIRSIVSPISDLKRLLLTLGKGIIPKEKVNKSNDEIGEMSVAMESLIRGFERTTLFAEQVGSGNFESEYHPLSNQDTLGATLLTMREDLKESKRNLEQKVEERTQEVVKQKNEIEHLLKEVTDSINYAKRIQRSLLASNTLLDSYLKNYFVFFQPKDIVSGDFYWATPLSNNQFALVTADSTGHGVPGAIMSILNISCLNEAVNGQKLVEPKEILNHTRRKIIANLSNDGSAEGGKDGMDCSLISFDFENNQLTYSAANNPVWIIREISLEAKNYSNEEEQLSFYKANKFSFSKTYVLLEFDPDKMPVGKHERDSTSFTQHTIDLQKDDVVYALTDGMPDQFGGPRGRKFMYKQLKELLINISDLSMTEQKIMLSNAFAEWKQDLEQVDDVCLIGVRI